MSLFHHKLKQIKKNKNGKHIIIKFDSNEIILKLVDTSEDTVNLLYRLRKKLKDKFNDEEFILSLKKGYQIKWPKKI